MTREVFLTDMRMCVIGCCNLSVRAKEATNMRSVIKEEGVKLAPPQIRTLEELIGYMADDEMIEVTPKSIRLRKAILDPTERSRQSRTKAKQIRAQKK